MLNWLLGTHTQIFPKGSSYTEIGSGGLQIESDGQKATLIQLDGYQGNETGRAILTVYDKNDLYLLENEIETTERIELPLLNTWQVLDGTAYQRYTGFSRVRLVYSHDCQLGFFCEMDPGFKFDEIHAIALSGHDFFKELYTVQRLKAHAQEEQAVAALLASKAHFQVLVDHHSCIASLVRAGVSIEKMVNISAPNLSVLLSKSEHLYPASQFLSINQLIGADRTPKAIPAKNNWPKLSTRGVAHIHTGNVSIVQTENRYTISYTKNGNTFEAEYHEYTANNDKDKAELDDLIVTSNKPYSLFHDWYHAKSTEGDIAFYYAPELGWVSRVKQSAGFQVAETHQEDYRHHFRCFRENKFIAYLQIEGMTKEDFLQIPGINPVKIELMCMNLEAVKFLKTHGLQIADYGNVDENRLEYIFTYFKEAKSALEFVDVFDLLALRSTSPLLRAYGTRTRPAIETQERQIPLVESQSPSCNIF